MLRNPSLFACFLPARLDSYLPTYLPTYQPLTGIPIRQQTSWVTWARHNSAQKLAFWRKAPWCWACTAPANAVARMSFLCLLPRQANEPFSGWARSWQMSWFCSSKGKKEKGALNLQLFAKLTNRWIDRPWSCRRYPSPCRQDATIRQQLIWWATDHDFHVNSPTANNSILQET